MDNVFDTSKVTNMSHMFDGCTTERIDLSDWDTSKVTSMSYMFRRCSKVKSLDLSDFDTSNVTTMYAMFGMYDNDTNTYATALETINFGNKFVTSKVTEMGAMFTYCSELTSLNVTGFNTSNVTGMGHMFNNCSKLTALDVSGFDTSKAKSMAYMFNNCSGLTELDVTGFNTSNVTDMESMFARCFNIETLDLTSFNTSKVTNMYGMFNMGIEGSEEGGNLTKLKTIFASNNFVTSSVVPGENNINKKNMFNQCKQIVGGAGTVYDSAPYATEDDHVDIQYAHIDYADHTPGYFTNSDYRTITWYDDDETTVLDKWAVPRAQVNSVDPDNDYTKATPAKYGYTFTGWSAPDTDANGNVSYTAQYISSTLTFEAFEGQGVYDFSTLLGWYSANGGAAFDNIESIVFDTISNFHTNYPNHYALNLVDSNGITCPLSPTYNQSTVDEYGRTGWTASILGYPMDTTGDSIIDTLFVISDDVILAPENCQALFAYLNNIKTITFNNINTSEVKNMDGMFGQCPNLETVDISLFDTSSVTTATQIFAEDPNLKTIYASEIFDLSKLDDTGTSDIFKNCTSLIGGAGTTFNSAYTDATYAHIDRGISNPGYFTDVRMKTAAAAPFTPIEDIDAVSSAAPVAVAPDAESDTTADVTAPSADEIIPEEPVVTHELNEPAAEVTEPEVAAPPQEPIQLEEPDELPEQQELPEPDGDDAQELGGEQA